MIVPVGKSFDQTLLLITKDNKGEVSQKKLMPVRFVPMVPGDSRAI
jgi:protein-L-isoaspartate O-methyltransferase